MSSSGDITTSRSGLKTKIETVSASWNFFRQSLIFWPVFALLCSLSATVFLWQSSRQATRQELQADFERQTSEVISSLEKELATHELLLRGVEGLFNASGHVARNDFRRYYQALQLNARSSGFSALAYHELVLDKNLAHHLAVIRREGFPDYRVLPEGQRELYARRVHFPSAPPLIISAD